ncbi:MAG TPA: hypothetical protein VK672_03705 [Solirubrobacteraceae bacterium]|nr:hypothetical protein [Solirubrobacteraceae bacterium]
MLVSVTDFRLNAAQDLPGAYRAAMRLRRAWPELEGAIGMWLWAKPLQKRSGSVSVWQREEDLSRFVRWPVHVAIMRKYREAGEMTSTSWHSERFAAAQTWQEAVRFLTIGEISERPNPSQRGGR